MSRCVFCSISSGDAPADVVYKGLHFMAFVPINPVTPGHLLVIPRAHFMDASDDPYVTGLAAEAAAKIAKPPYNLITNCGEVATQSVFHLHWHIVPRSPGDGLTLPWT